MEMVYCRTCGAKILKEAEICIHCGVRQLPNMNNKPYRNKMIAGVLALFLGYLGIHKFYLGKSSGIWYIIFCWTFIPFIIAFVEALGFFLMSEQEFNQRYN